MTTTYFIFGGVASMNKGMDDINHIGRPIQSGSREHTTIIPGLFGAIYHGADIREAIISVRGYSKASTMANRIKIIRDLQGWLVGNELRSLIFSDETDRFYMAKLTGEIEPSIRGLLLFWNLFFLVPDACAYALTPKIATFPLDPAEKAINAGTLSCPCTITCTMTGPESDLKVVLSGTDEYILLDREVAKNDIIVIDTARHLVTINGIDARSYVTVLSSYFRLPVGEFSLSTEQAAMISVEYREMWG